MKKIKIGILYGGTSPERIISIKTASMIIGALNRNKYTLLPIEISKEGRYIFRNIDDLDKNIYSDTNYNLSSLQDLRMIVKTNIKLLAGEDIDLMFIALHGVNGEDGTIQGLLQCLKIPYTGSGITPSAIAIDKNLTKQLYLHNKIPTPDWLYISKENFYSNKEKCFKELSESKIVSGDFIIKPDKGGSSIGIMVVKDKIDSKEKLEAVIDNYFNSNPWESDIIIEEFITGTEVTCGVIETKDSIKSLPPIEIKFNSATHDYYDYNDKYEPFIATSTEVRDRKVQHEVLADVSPSVINKIKELSLKIHSTLGCSGISATDFIIDNNDNIIAIETNTIPGLTKTSIIPRAAKAANIEFEELLENLIEAAWKK